MPLGPADLVVTPAMLGAGEVTDVTLRQADDLAQRAAYVPCSPRAARDGRCPHGLCERPTPCSPFLSNHAAIDRSSMTTRSRAGCV